MDINKILRVSEHMDLLRENEQLPRNLWAIDAICKLNMPQVGIDETELEEIRALCGDLPSEPRDYQEWRDYLEKNE